MMPAVIETDRLTKIFPGRRAVDSLCLCVDEREIFGLLGPNGAGKTTTVGMLTTRVRPTAGSASVAFHDVVREPDAVKAAIGVVTQANTLDRSLLVHENLTFHGRYMGLSRREAARRAESLIEQLGLGDHARAEVDTLSVGLAQRVMLARALIARPRLLLLDEPTNGLDPAGREELWQIVRELPGQGVSLLVTTHRLDEAERLCTMVGIMSAGVLLAVDRPAALIHEGGDRVIVRVRTAGNPGPLATAVDTEPVEIHETGVSFATGDGPALAQTILAIARDRGVPVVSMDIGSSTLEATFLRLVNQHRLTEREKQRA